MWFFKKKQTPVSSDAVKPQDVETSAPPETPPIPQYKVERKNPFLGKKFGDLIDDIVIEHEKSGGFEHLEGKGKPLRIEENISEDFILYKTLKNANVLPPWLALQHEIRDDIESLLKQIACNAKVDVDANIMEINQKITTYNEKCPSPLQKAKITANNIEKQYIHWT